MAGGHEPCSAGCALRGENASGLPLRVIAQREVQNFGELMTPHCGRKQVEHRFARDRRFMRVRKSDKRAAFVSASMHVREARVKGSRGAVGRDGESQGMQAG